MADDRCESYQGACACSRGAGRQSGDGSHTRGLNTKLHLAVDAAGLPLRALITAGTVADCRKAVALIEGFTAEHLLADRGYDTNKVLLQASAQKMEVVIPPKKNRIEQREYDKAGYNLRHLVENAFMRLKR